MLTGMRAEKHMRPPGRCRWWPASSAFHAGPMSLPRFNKSKARRPCFEAAGDDTLVAIDGGAIAIFYKPTTWPVLLRATGGEPIILE